METGNSVASRLSSDEESGVTPSSPLIDAAEKMSPSGQPAEIRQHQSKVTASSSRMHTCMSVYRVLK